jgi:spermidine/putrescine-binding protein
MKAKVLLISLVVSMFTLISCKSVDPQKKQELNVYNWGDYIDDTVIELFENETGISVNYELFSSNEAMYTKIKTGGSEYDIAIPSDYMIQKMIEEDMLEKIDFSNVPNMANIDNKLKGLAFDKSNEYSVPYMWGTLGILYNTNMVDEVVDSFDILWDEKYKNKIFMYDSQRDTLAVSLIRLGYSINTIDENELNLATEELIKQKNLVQAYLGDPIKDNMIGNEGALAIVYSGDALYTMSENEDLNYVIPKEGSNIWVDSIVIPKGSKNKEEAEKFINFLSRPDIALLNTEYIGFSTTNAETFKLLPEELQQNEIYWPSDEIFSKLEIFVSLGDAIKIYDEAWNRIMLAK